MNYGNIFYRFCVTSQNAIVSVSVADLDIDTYNPRLNSQPLK